MSIEPDDLNPLGLNVDIRDVDRLRTWARHLGPYNLLSPNLLDLANRPEQEVKDVGELRKQVREGQEAGYGHGV